MKGFDLIDEKSYKNILFYNISYKVFHVAKPLGIRFDKVGGFIRVYNGTRYLVLFVDENYDLIYNRIKCLIGEKNGTTYVMSHIYEKTKLDSYDSLTFKKILTCHNVIILIKSVFNKDKNNYYYNIFLEKGLC